MQYWSDNFKAKWAFGQQRSSSAGGIGRSGGSLGAMEAVSAGAGAPPPPGEDRWEELCSMEAALEAEVSELRLTVASPTSVGTVGTVGRVVEAESEGDENTSPSRDLRSDSSYWGSRGQNRRAVRRADVSGVAPVREEGDYEKRFEVTQRLSPKPAVTRPARRGGRDAGAPVAQVSPIDVSPIVEKPKWGGKYGDDGLRVSRYDFAFMVPKRSTASPSRAGAARTRELSTPPPRKSMLSPANEVAKSWERNLRSKGTTPTRAPAVQRMSPHHHDDKPTTSREDADASLNDASLNVVAEVEARVQEKLRQLETRLLRSVGKKQKPKKERTPKKERMRRKSDDSSDSSDAGPATTSTDAEDWTSAVKFTEPISAADRVTERSKLAERSKLVESLEGPSGSGSNKDRPLRAVKNSIDEYLHRRRKRREEEREETRESERRALEAAGAVRSEGVDEFEPVYSPVVARRASKSVQDVSKMRDLDETDSLTTESEDGHPASSDGHLQAAWSASPSSTHDASSSSSPTSSRSIADDDEFLQVAFAATEVVHRRRLVASVLEEWSFMVRWGRARAEAHRHRHLKWASVKVMRSLMTDARISARVSERFHRSLRRVKMRAALRSWLFIAKDALVRAAKERRDQALKGEWPSESGSDGDSDDSAKDSEVLTEDDTEALRREAWMPLRDELKILDTEERKPVVEEREESRVHEESLVHEESSGDGGFSPENKAEFEKSYDDALKAVDVAVRGVIGLWTLATPEKPTPSSGTRPSAPPAVEGLGSQAPTARTLKFDPLRVGDWLTNQEEPEVSSEEEDEVEEDEEVPSDFITPLGAAPPLSDVRPYRVFTDETGQSFVLTSSPEAGGSTHEYMSMKDWIEFASKAI